MGGIDGSGSVGSAALLNKFIYSPSNDEGADRNKPAASATDTSYLNYFKPAERETLKSYAQAIEQNYRAVAQKGKDAHLTDIQVKVAVAKAALEYDHNEKSAQNETWLDKTWQVFAPKAEASPVILIVVGVIVLGHFLTACSESGNDKIAPPQSGNNPDGGAPESDAGGLTNTGVIVTPDGPIPCDQFPGGCIINLPTPNTLPDASTINVVKPDAAPIVIPDTAPVVVPITLVDSGVPTAAPEIDSGVTAVDDGGVIPLDGGIIMPDGSVILPDTNYVYPVNLDGPVKVPQLPADARPANPIDAESQTPLTGKILLFSEHTFDIKLTGNAATVQQAINANPFTVTNTQGKLDCSANTQYYLVFWSQGNLVADTSGTPLEKYFPNVCKNGVLSIARQSDIDPKFTNDQGYPYGFLFPPDQSPRPPLVLTSVLSGATKLLDNSFDQGLPIGDKEAACAGELSSVPTKVLIPQNTYCPAGDLNLTVDKATFMADTSPAARLSSTLAPYWRQNIWLGVVEVKK